LLKTQLQQWCKLNEFDTRTFKIFRNVLKYGDQVFVRDPENFKLFWVDMTKIIKVIVNESEGKKPEQYVIKDININLQNLTVATKTNTDFAANPATGLGGTGGGSQSNGYTVPAMPYNTTGSRFTLGQSESAVPERDARGGGDQNRAYASDPCSHGACRISRAGRPNLRGREGSEDRRYHHPRQMLHAESLSLCHPVTGTPLTFTVPPPPDMVAIMEVLNARMT
jgi:hypothetical protein